MIINRASIRAIFMTIFLTILSSTSSFADGGCVKVADDSLVQLSMVPVAPAAKEKVSLVFSFGNLSMNLINKPIEGRLYITKNQKTVFEKNFSVNSGVLDLRYAFDEPGYYEIFTEFSMNGKKYTPEDFLVEVTDKKQNFVPNVIFFVAGVVIGSLFIALAKLRRPKKRL